MLLYEPKNGHFATVPDSEEMATPTSVQFNCSVSMINNKFHRPHWRWSHEEAQQDFHWSKWQSKEAVRESNLSGLSISWKHFNLFTDWGMKNCHDFLGLLLLLLLSRLLIRWGEEGNLIRWHSPKSSAAQDDSRWIPGKAKSSLVSSSSSAFYIYLSPVGGSSIYYQYDWWMPRLPKQPTSYGDRSGERGRRSRKGLWISCRISGLDYHRITLPRRPCLPCSCHG